MNSLKNLVIKFLNTNYYIGSDGETYSMGTTNKIYWVEITIKQIFGIEVIEAAHIVHEWQNNQLKKYNVRYLIAKYLSKHYHIEGQKMINTELGAERRAANLIIELEKVFGLDKVGLAGPVKYWIGTQNKRFRFERYWNKLSHFIYTPMLYSEPLRFRPAFNHLNIGVDVAGERDEPSHVYQRQMRINPTFELNVEDIERLDIMKEWRAELMTSI